MFSPKRLGVYIILSAVSLFLLLRFDVIRITSVSPANYEVSNPEVYKLPPKNENDTAKFDWASRQEHFPISEHEFAPIPKPSAKRLPKIQHSFGVQESHLEDTRKDRQSKVKEALQRCWTSYRDRAWLQDELTPISGGAHNPFGGWAATLVDTLDTLWIMDLRDEFWDAVEAVVQIDFSHSSQDTINVFETTIRYLGGFLSAYDLSGDKRLLNKALELADMLYAAFDTPNRMPITRWDFNKAAKNEEPQVAPDGVLVAEIGSLSLEFTRLAQITNNPKWYDTVARVMAVFSEQQNSTNLPGMWPLSVNARDMDFTSGTLFTLGAMSDSVYEYLPKMHALLGGSEQYAEMHRRAMDAATQYALYRPMTPQDSDILMAGPVTADNGQINTRPEGQHLVCFAGGMLALGGRLLRNESHIQLGRKLTDGCVWAYEASKLGIMPETYTVVPCEDRDSCTWDETKWHADALERGAHSDPNVDLASFIEQKRLPPGFSSMPDRRYLLRPEAIESVFILYRTTGDPKLQDVAWNMFSNIYKYTKTEFANAALADVSDSSAPKSDSMESFWTAETLKYFYLVFSDTDLISLDEYVFNTEAHPLRRAAPTG